jgi:hypothetical protein
MAGAAVRAEAPAGPTDVDAAEVVPLERLGFLVVPAVLSPLLGRGIAQAETDEPGGDGGPAK